MEYEVACHEALIFDRTKFESCRSNSLSLRRAHCPAAGHGVAPARGAGARQGGVRSHGGAGCCVFVLYTVLSRRVMSRCVARPPSRHLAARINCLASHVSLSASSRSTRRGPPGLPGARHPGGVACGVRSSFERDSSVECTLQYSCRPRHKIGTVSYKTHTNRYKIKPWRRAGRNSI